MPLALVPAGIDAVHVPGLPLPPPPGPAVVELAPPTELIPPAPSVVTEELPWVGEPSLPVVGPPLVAPPELLEAADSVVAVCPSEAEGPVLLPDVSEAVVTPIPELPPAVWLAPVPPMTASLPLLVAASPPFEDVALLPPSLQPRLMPSIAVNRVLLRACFVIM
ncbi:MAG TPA: hypothetical protein VFU02_13420 [Polyangiaceae bacterium]|nr:hypothetical protein [Polyangiaceae bacterium]